MNDVSGTLRKVTLNGVTYRVKNDINLTFYYSAYETEDIPTTGKTMYKMTLRNQNVENCDLITNYIEAGRLQELADSIETHTMAFELANGAVFKGNGKINYESWETEENVSKIKLIPDKARKAWTPFSP